MGGQWFPCLTFGPLTPNNDWWYQPFLQSNVTGIKYGATIPRKRRRLGKSHDYG